MPGGLVASAHQRVWSGPGPRWTHLGTGSLSKPRSFRGQVSRTEGWGEGSDLKTGCPAGPSGAGLGGRVSRESPGHPSLLAPLPVLLITQVGTMGPLSPPGVGDPGERGQVGQEDALGWAGASGLSTCPGHARGSAPQTWSQRRPLDCPWLQPWLCVGLPPIWASVPHPLLMLGVVGDGPSALRRHGSAGPHGLRMLRCPVQGSLAAGPRPARR